VADGLTTDDVDVVHSDVSSNIILVLKTLLLKQEACFVGLGLFCFCFYLRYRRKQLQTGPAAAMGPPSVIEKSV